jgi:hypothetical protein
MRNSPSSEMTTVVPAISTERPAVETDSATASRELRPAPSALR